MGFLSRVSRGFVSAVPGLGTAVNVVDGARALGGSSPAAPVREGASSAWDVLSGERDYRRQKRDTAAARDYTAGREDTAYQRAMADLEQAGINPMLAGQLGGAGSSSPQVPQSRTAEGVSRIAGMAGSVLSGSVGAVNTLAQANLAKATSAKNLADAASITARLPSGIASEVALAGLRDAQAGMSTAHSAEATLRTDQQRTRWPQFHAEAAYYKEHGSRAVKADKIRNPWQSSSLLKMEPRDESGRTRFTFDSNINKAINSAAAALARGAQSVNVKAAPIRKRSGRVPYGR